MLRFKNINTYYGKVHALKNVSLHLAEGEIVTLIGGPTAPARPPSSTPSPG